MTFSLRLNINTIVPDSLNRYDRKQLPCLLFREWLGSPACVLPVTFSLHSNVDTVVPVSLNRCDSETHFARGSVAQLASASTMIREAHTIMLGPVHKREVLCASQHWMHLHDHHVFCMRPYHSDQSDALGHKWTLSEKYFLYNIIIIVIIILILLFTGI